MLTRRETIQVGLLALIGQQPPDPDRDDLLDRLRLVELSEDRVGSLRAILMAYERHPVESPN